MNDMDLNYKLELEEFDEICAPFLERLAAPVKKALADSGIEASKLSSVEIVGGGARVQCVKRTLAGLFGTEGELNYGLSATLNMDEAVARGAALQCAILSPVFRVADYDVVDRVSLPVRLSWEQSAGAMETDAGESEENAITIFQEGDATPATKRITFRRSEAFEVVAAYDEAAVAQLPKGASTSLGRITVQGMPQTVGFDEEKEVPKIRVDVRHDIHGCFEFKEAVYMEELPPEPEAPAAAPEAEGAPKVTADPPPTPEGGDAGAAGAAGAEGGNDADATAEGKDSAPAAESKDAAPAEEAGGSEPPKKKKKKYKKVALTLAPDEASRMGLSASDLSQACAREATMLQRDTDIRKLNETRNELESYSYEVREKLGDYGELKDFASEPDRESLRSKATAAEDWLYSEEGEEADLATVAAKLSELKVAGDAIANRRRESVARPDATSRFLSAIEEYRLIADSEDEKYAHLGDTDRDTLRGECKTQHEWHKELADKQAELAQHDDPVLTVALIHEHHRTLDNACRPIATKPKPKPKEPEKKEEENKEEAKQAEGSGAESAQNAEGAADGAAPMDTEGAAATGEENASGDAPDSKAENNDGEEKMELD